MTQASRSTPAVFLATGAWVGFVPFAPGTFGTLWGLPLAWAVAQIPTTAGQIIAILAICAVGIPICTLAVRDLGGAKDPGCIVFDEIAGVVITFFLVPLNHWTIFLAGFALFRLFDITKPPPARQVERLTEGLGIMADDWIAGVFSNLCLRLLVWAGVWG